MRSARRGAAAGPLISEHLFPMLENDGDLQALTEFTGIMARGDVPLQAMEVLRLGRMSALQKPDGRLRGIVVEDIFRRIVARTMAQRRDGLRVPHHTDLHLDPPTTILSVDAVGAFDVICRNSMMQGLLHMEGDEKLLLFVRMFYSTPSSFLWEDEDGTVHFILLPSQTGFPMGNASAHFWMICMSLRILNELWFATRSWGRILGSDFTMARRQCGTAEVRSFPTLERAARLVDPSARVWRGDIHSIPEESGILILGPPVGTPEFVLRQLEVKAAEHQALLQRIPDIQDLQCTWLILLFSAAARANLLISSSGRSAPPCPMHSQPNMMRRSGVVLHVGGCGSSRVPPKLQVTSLWPWEDLD